MRKRSVKNKNELTITQHNALIEARYKLTLDEQRLILACIAQIDPRKPISPADVFVITAEDFAELFGVRIESAYTQMKEALQRLYDQSIFTFDGKHDRAFHWLAERTYVPTEGRVELAFGLRVIPYLSRLHKEFTSYKLKKIAAFKSVHSMRIYEMLSRYKDTGQWHIGLDHLKDCLGIAEQYPEFANLKQRVIEPAIKEINAKSDLRVEWEPIRKGRAVVSLAFAFEGRSPDAAQRNPGQGQG